MATTASDFMVKMPGGKEYLAVAGRVLMFRDSFPNGGIRTEWLVVMDNIIAKATIYNDAGEILATGHGTLRSAAANERWKGREFERAETAALGRALSFAGFGTADADDDESNLADSPVDEKPEPPNPKPPTPPSSPTPPAKNEKPDLAVVERTDITPRDDEPMARVAGADTLTPEQVEDAKKRLGNKHSIDANRKPATTDADTKTFECVKINIIERKDGENGEGGGLKYQFIGTGAMAESYSRQPLRDAGYEDTDIPEGTGPHVLPRPIRVTAKATHKNDKTYWNVTAAEAIA